MRLLKGPDLPDIPYLGVVVEWAATTDPLAVAFVAGVVVFVVWRIGSALLGGKRR